MSKREARIARQLEKQLKEIEKSARLVETVRVEMRPRQAAEPAGGNTPRAAENPNSIMSMRMEYRILDYADRDGSWAWGQLRNWCDPERGHDNSCLIRSTMMQMSALYWHEIHAQTTGGKERHYKHHSQPWDSICPEAQGRWVEIGRVEDELFRFRTGGKERIWGFRTGHVFNVVWWDAEHQIYPVD